MGIADRVDEYIKQEAFVTVKDHKPNFPDRKQYRLLNPAKSNVGKVSKTILETAVSKVKSATNLNLWQNSDQVIEWFSGLQNKNKLTFFKFDVVSFYPSISKELFDIVINWSVWREVCCNSYRHETLCLSQLLQRRPNISSVENSIQ